MLILIFITAILLLFLPSSFLLPLFFILIFLISIKYKNKNLEKLLLIFSLLFSLLNWTYMSFGIIFWDWSFLIFSSSIRALSLIYIFYFFLKNSNSINFNIVIIMFFLTLFSFLKSEDLFTAFKYLVNVYFPLIVSILILLNFNNFKFSSVSISSIIKNTLIILIFFNIYLLLLDFVDFLSLKLFFNNVSEQLRSAGEGNYRTVIMGKHIERMPGIFADPIVAGYFLVTSYFYLLYTIKNNYAKILMLVIILILILITFSKAAYILLFLGHLGIFIKSLRLSIKVKILLFLFIYAISLFIAILRALQDGVTDSSAIHVLGLTLPFVNLNGLEFLFGSDLGSGGNMGGWVNQGAESFVGLLMHNLGIIGVILYIYVFYKVVNSAFKKEDIVAKYIMGAILPLFWVSFLQENTFNLSYSVPRLVLFIGILFFSIENRRKQVNENK